jgi:hypothetical protein
MKSFRLRITDKVYFDAKDGKRSAEIAEERQGLETEDFPKIVTAEEGTAEDFWKASEELRRGKAIGLPPTTLHKLQNEVLRQQIAFKMPRVDLQKKSHALYDELVKLTSAYRGDIVREIEAAMDEVIAMRSAQTVSSERRLIDKGSKGEGEITVRLLEDNFGSVEKIVDCLNDLRFKIRNSLGAASHAEILEAVKNAETEINHLNTGSLQQREISESEWKDLRESKAI